jgi:NAD(P)H-dependent FMN reductase
MPKLSVVISSTRPGRAGVAMDEPNHPMLRRYEHDHTKAWSAQVDAADAFVFVTAEYNYGFTAPLKNAIDYLHAEWQHKPVGFVSYGGVGAGTRAVQMLKQVVTTLKMVPLVEAVNIPFHPQFIDEDGAVQANEVMDQSATTLLDELAAVESALRPRRAAARAGG